MEHLSIHLPYEAKVGGPVQYHWMYPFERYLFYLKKKVGNKAHVEGSIAEAYLIDEISNFTSSYFGLNVDTIWNQPLRNDDGGEVKHDGRLSLFCQPGRPLSNAFVKRTLTPEEHQIVHKYVLLNCVELKEYIIECKNDLRRQHLEEDENYILIKLESIFPDWLKTHVPFQSDGIGHQLYLLAQGPNYIVKCYNGYYVNGFKFHTLKYGKNKTTMNSGIYVKGSCYDELENDYYGMINEVIEVTYLGERNNIFVFNCEWFDTSNKNGIKVHPRNGMVELRKNSRLRTNDVFVFAHQCQQVYFICQPGNGSKEWFTVIKTVARSRFLVNMEKTNLEDEDADVDQLDETFQPSMVDLDDRFDLPQNIQHYDDIDFEELIRAMQPSNCDDYGSEDEEADVDNEVTDDLDADEDSEDEYSS